MLVDVNPNRRGGPARPEMRLAALFLGLYLAGCSSTEARGEPFTPSEKPPNASIAELMRNLDRLLSQWTALALEPATARVRSFRFNVELELAKEVKSRFEDVKNTLESSPVVRNRGIAAAAIGFAREREALIPLMNALADPSPDVREKALLGIGVLGDKNTPIEPIVDQLDHGQTDIIQSNAAFALYRLAQEGARIDAAFPALRKALQHPNPAVRVQVAAAVGEARDVGAVAPLTALLGDSRTLVAAAAANALGKIGSTSSIIPLIDALTGKEAALRIEARAALTRLTGGSDLGAEPGPWRAWLESRSTPSATRPTSAPSTMGLDRGQEARADRA